MTNFLRTVLHPECGGGYMKLCMCQHFIERHSKKNEYVKTGEIQSKFVVNSIEATSCSETCALVI